MALPSADSNDSENGQLVFHTCDGTTQQDEVLPIHTKLSSSSLSLTTVVDNQIISSKSTNDIQLTPIQSTKDISINLNENEKSAIVTPIKDGNITSDSAKATLLTIQELSHPVNLTFCNVSKVLTVPAQMVDPTSTEKFIERKLLHNVSGEVKAGEVIALMGPSGSGKTTLLNTLAGRAPMGVSGGIYFNGVPYSKDMKRMMGYVLQNDIFFEKLTVRQQLTYTALLRLPGNLTRKEKRACVEKVIEKLGLTKCANTPLFLVSGGEKKRVNIGTEILTDPSIIFLDEPTSGLDSTSAMSLIETLRQLAKNGKTIISSIHQPSSQVFASFDRLILLADGHPIFIGKPLDAIEYFQLLGHVCPQHYNPADYIMDLVSQPAVKEQLISAYQTNHLQYGKGLNSSSANLKAQQYLVTEPIEPKISQAEIDAEINTMGLTGSKWPIGWVEQFRILFSRSFTLTWSQQFTKLNFIQSIALAVISGLCWLRMGRDESTVVDRSSYVFFAMTFWPLQTLFSALLSFPFERAVIDKERASGSYRLSAYFLANSVAAAPMKLVLPIIYLVISYWMANINPAADNFLGLIASEIASVLVAESIGLLIGASVANMQQALVAATVSVLGLMLVGGFFIQNLPGWLNSWAPYISFFTYSFNASRQFEFRGDYLYSCNYPPGQQIIPACKNGSPTFTGAEALAYLDADRLSIGANFGCLFAMFFGFRYLAYLALRFLKNHQGRM